MAKLRDVRFLCPGGLQSETVTYLDIIMTKQLSNGACHSILFKLIMAILRQESSEALRRRYWFYDAEIAFTFLFSWNKSWFCSISLISVNTPCFLAISSTVSICLILVYLLQWCSSFQWMIKIMKIPILKRLYKYLCRKDSYCPSSVFFLKLAHRSYWNLCFLYSHNQIVKDQAELSHANFSILRKDAQAILDLVGDFVIYLLLLLLVYFILVVFYAIHGGIVNNSAC